MKKLWGEISKEKKDWVSDEIDFIFVYTSDTEFQRLLFGLCETPNFRIVLVYKANQSFRAVSCPEKTHFLLIIGRYLIEKVVSWGTFQNRCCWNIQPYQTKTTLCWKIFYQFFLRTLTYIHRTFEDHSGKNGGAISRSVFR